MKSGVELITEERNRQIFVLDYTREHDDSHLNGELIQYAVSHMFRDCPIFTNRPAADEIETHMKNLVQAGALIAAEIDRLQHFDPSETYDD